MFLESVERSFGVFLVKSIVGVDAFYKKHSERTLNALKKHTLLLTALGVDPADLGPVAGCEARRLAVVEASGNCTAANLKSTIETLTAEWLPKEEEHAAA